jgi:hypothetical protein
MAMDPPDSAAAGLLTVLLADHAQYSSLIKSQHDTIRELSDLLLALRSNSLPSDAPAPLDHQGELEAEYRKQKDAIEDALAEKAQGEYLLYERRRELAALLDAGERLAPAAPSASAAPTAARSTVYEDWLAGGVPPRAQAVFDSALTILGPVNSWRQERCGGASPEAPTTLKGLSEQFGEAIAAIRASYGVPGPGK